jgi:hypothetical protein
MGIKPMMVFVRFVIQRQTIIGTMGPAAPATMRVKIAQTKTAINIYIPTNSSLPRSEWKRGALFSIGYSIDGEATEILKRGVILLFKSPSGCRSYLK